MRLKTNFYSILFNGMVFLYLLIIGILSTDGTISYGNGLGDLAYFYSLWLIIVIYLIVGITLLFQRKNINKKTWIIGLIFLIIALYFTYSFTIGKGIEYS